MQGRKQMLSNSVLDFSSGQYGFDKATLRFVADGNYSAKQFYSFIKNNESYVLRVTKNPANDVDQTRAEMDWLCYLVSKGVSVSKPLKTVNGELAVSVEESGELCVITAYRKAEGRPFDINDPDLWNQKVFHNWGRVMGEMHLVTKDYKPAAGTERYRNIRNNINNNVKKFPSVNRIADRLIDEILALPKDRDSYGMIHADLGPTNFLIDGDHINVFDFEECQYSWFAHDIGAALTFAMWFGQRNAAGYDFTNDIFTSFLAGYLSANNLNDFWLSRIPLFMRLYQIAGFAFMNHTVDPNDVKQKEQVFNIENGILFPRCTID